MRAPYRRTLRAALLILAGLMSAAEVAANPYVYGSARFTVVTPECIRLEYQPDGKFVDAPSMFAVGRGVLDDKTVEEKQGNAHVLHTGRMRLVYTPDSQPFSPANLAVEIDGGERTINWSPASHQAANLGGTINTLDQVKGPVSLEEGILSRDGWYLLDDSKGFLLVNDWVAPRPADAGSDWYLFGYGADYPAAFRAFTTIGGAVPMPRKAILGSWYSRWWKYTTADYKEIVNEYAQHDFPLDIIVMDMEWHKQGWTGWSWNYELLDDPPALLKWFHEQGLSVTLNVHPSDGVVATETMYGDFMKELGKNPLTKQVVPFDAGSREYMAAYFKHTHWPREAEGVDFWWLDWQQYPDVLSIPGLLNLSWLNKLYFDNSMREGKRGLQFSRWGAWGDHRHPIHFSGDADTGWPMLGFEVPFTSTAGNEGAYFWSHDIGGHFGDRNEEPYTRWVQFASMTAAMRIHSGIIPYLDRRPWKWPDWGTESMRRSFHLRAELMPYVYSAVRQTNETGLPLNRPMYIEYPGEADAYRAPQQYLFGSDLLVAPIASAGHGPGRVASQLVWFPPGEWRNFFTDESFTGPEWRLVSADINEFPLYVRAGVPIPTQPYNARPTTAPLAALVVNLWPGPDHERRSFDLYEDDGISREYEKGAYAKTRLSAQRDGSSIQLRVQPDDGAFAGQVAKRGYEIVLHGVEKPRRVTIDGKRAAAAWDEESRTATIPVKPRAVHVPVAILVEASSSNPATFAEAALGRRLKGILGRDASAADLGAAIAEAAASSGDILPGLAALAGFGVAENGTHYPTVGTLERVVRNSDSLFDAKTVKVEWNRTLSPGDVASLHAETSLDNVTTPVAVTAPEWDKPELAFLEYSAEARNVTTSIAGKPITLTKPLGRLYGQARRWSVSPVFPFDRKIDISEQHHASENLTLDELAAPIGGWITVEADKDGLIDLAKARGGENVMAYATTTVELPEECAAVIGFRSDDGIEAWLNGEKIHSKHAFRGVNHDWEEAKVKFRKGRNVFLVKISQAEFGWGFLMAGRLDSERQ